MNPIGPLTSAPPRYEPLAARSVEPRARVAEPQQPQATPLVRAPLDQAAPPDRAAALGRAAAPARPALVDRPAPPEPLDNVAARVAEEVEAIRETVQQAVDRLNEQMRQSQRSLGFRVDEANDLMVVQVTNKETGELVREIPIEAAVRMADSFANPKGMLFDETL